MICKAAIVWLGLSTLSRVGVVPSTNVDAQILFPKGTSLSKCACAPNHDS